MPLRDLDSEVENIEKLFLLGLSQPAQERDGLKELEANFKESRRQATYRLLSLAPKEISDYYQQLIQRTQPGPHDFHSSPYPQMPTDKIVDYTESYRLRYNSARNFIKFNEDLGRWKTLSTQNQPDPFGLFQEVVGAAFALKSSQGLRPSIQEIYDRGPDLDASENTIDNLFGASEDHQAPDQHDSGISMGTSVEDSMYYQMPDEGADNP
ncbi:hypothetical protein FOIG_06590 [Fusarium odoratissimum NRRL 54006]|nr:uncharacterized protein FOIG_06590 [Fusarium odoratissimum NRRL 54006]EXM02331.1 hypothetical protein FOIG_06590 [Fusarium odoratissimum NRRL 54006]